MLWIDHGGEYCSKEFAHYLDVQHIMHEINMFYTSQENRIIEHNNQIVTKATHNMYVKGLPLCLWVKAIHIVAYLANKLSRIDLGDRPYEIWHETKLAISHYQMNYFAYMFIDRQLQSKCDAKKTKLVFVGYKIIKKGYRLW
jgi:hypothetical protein